MQLYSYFRFSAAHRMCNALAWKQFDHDHLAMHLACNERRAPGFADLAPGRLIPWLQVFNALCTGCSWDAWPADRHTADACLQPSAFADAQASACPDAA